MRKLRYALIGLLIAASCTAADYQPRCNLFKTALVGMGLFSMPKLISAEPRYSLTINYEENTMANQNSIFAPTPTAVAKGGTGNTATPANGQTWIGNGTATPALANITGGTNIGITSGAGTIQIRATGPASMTWNYNAVGGTTLAAFNGYTVVSNVAGNVNFVLPANAQLGDMYSIVCYFVTTPFNGFSVSVTGSQTIQHDGLTDNLLTFLGTNPKRSTAAVTLICVEGTLGSQIFSVLSSNAPDFV